MAGLTPSRRQALTWLSRRGGSAAIARTTNGGWYILAQGETATFERSTWKWLLEHGFIEQPGKRYVLTEAGEAEAKPKTAWKPLPEVEWLTGGGYQKLALPDSDNQ